MTQTPLPASVTIVDLPAATTLTGTELLEAVQTASGVANSVQVSVNQMLAVATGTAAALLNVADQLLSGGANVTAKSLSTGNVTIDCGTCPLQYITNGGAFTITAPARDGSCVLLVSNNASAGTITFSGFSVGVVPGDLLDTTSGHAFSIFIWRINGVSGYRVSAHQ